MRTRQIFILLLLGFAAIAQEPHRPASGEAAAVNTAIPVSASPADLAAGRRLFQAHCALCHGAQGEGGKGEGWFFALDATSGQPLWRFSTGGSIMANPVSFLVDGRQHIAIAAASAVFVFSL